MMSQMEFFFYQLKVMPRYIVAWILASIPTTLRPAKDINHQKFVTTAAKGSRKTLSHEKFDLVVTPLSKTWHVFSKKMMGGNYSLTGFTINLSRNPTPFHFNTYLPTTLLTIISFIGFLMPIHAEEGRRMALLITIFLMLVTISGIEKNRGPIVSVNKK